MNPTDFLRCLCLGILEDTKVEWKEKYHYVFSHDFRQLLVTALGSYKASNIVWLDPDEGYEDDVRAYLKVVLELL